jgi:hypothetical protein
VLGGLLNDISGPYIHDQVLSENSKDKDITGDLMPNLIYVSRQKSKTSPHHFKAGALNVLVSNGASQYLIVFGFVFLFITSILQLRFYFLSLTVYKLSYHFKKKKEKKRGLIQTHANKHHVTYSANS